MVPGISFFIFSNADIYFIEQKFTWKSYIIAKALPISQKVELINKKKFAKIAFDKNIKAFVVNVNSLVSKITIYPVGETQIALLLAKKTIVPAKYLDFADVFLEKSPNVFLE